MDLEIVLSYQHCPLLDNNGSVLTSRKSLYRVCKLSQKDQPVFCSLDENLALQISSRCACSITDLI